MAIFEMETGVASNANMKMCSNAKDNQVYATNTKEMGYVKGSRRRLVPLIAGFMFLTVSHSNGQ